MSVPFFIMEQPKSWDIVEQLHRDRFKEAFLAEHDETTRERLKTILMQELCQEIAQHLRKWLHE